MEISEIKEGLPFEDALERLEEIVRLLEGGSSRLDDSLKLFEEGVALVRYCNSRLDTAEQKVKLISLLPDGEGEVDMPRP